MSHRADVWISKRKGKKGTAYSVRWVDADSGRCRSEACGPDRKHADLVAREKRRDLQLGIRGETKHVSWAAFAAALISAMRAA